MNSGTCVFFNKHTCFLGGLLPVLLRAVCLVRRTEGTVDPDPDTERLNSMQIYEIYHLLVSIMLLAVSTTNSQ
jgi:hypothetical protein